MNKEEQPKEFRDLIDALDAQKVSGHERVSIALFMAMAAGFKNADMSMDMRLDLFRAGMHAYRLASVDSYLEALFLNDESLKRMEDSGGVSILSLMTIGMESSREAAKSVNKFLNMCELLKG